MTQPLTPLDSTLLTIVLATLAIGLPILLVLAIRFLWDRSLYLGRSKELEKLIWQLHRIASAMEHQMNLSFPAVQPGTEEPNDLTYLQKPASRTKPDAQAAAPGVATPNAEAPTAKEASEQQPAVAEHATQHSGLPPLVPRDPSEPPRHGGVNSMFGF